MRNKDITETHKDSSGLTWMFVKKWGNMYVAPKEDMNWRFNFSKEYHKYWKFIPELGVYRSNVSA